MRAIRYNANWFRKFVIFKRIKWNQSWQIICSWNACHNKNLKKSLATLIAPSITVEHSDNFDLFELPESYPFPIQLKHLPIDWEKKRKFLCVILRPFTAAIKPFHNKIEHFVFHCVTSMKTIQFQCYISLNDGKFDNTVLLTSNWLCDRVRCGIDFSEWIWK